MNRWLLMWLGVSLMFVTGCSEKQVYRGFQERNRVDCMALPLPQQEDCLKEMESPLYEDYMRERERNFQ